jgi:ADP-ribosyltransferase-like protein
VKVDKHEQGKGTGRALYAAFNEKHGGRIMPSGKTEPSAWKLWKRNYPEKVDAFVEQEAARIRDGADPKIVAGNITDPEVRARVLKASEPEPTPPAPKKSFVPKQPENTDAAAKQPSDSGAVRTAPDEPEEIFSAEAHTTETPAFKKWFGESKVVDDEGKPLVVYHGTTGDFHTFNKTRANPESDLGAGFYFSSSPEDVGHNYAGEGPDLTNKIELLAERLEQEHSDEGHDITMTEAREMARKELSVQHGGASVPVYLKMENPLRLGGPKETFLDYELPTDEHGDYAGEEPKGAAADVIESIRQQLAVDEHFDGDFDKVMSDVGDDLYDGIKASKLWEKLKASEGLMHVVDDEGKLVSNEIIRQAFQDAGFDGIIDKAANKKFGTERPTNEAPPMKGVDEDTTHYVVFKPEQVKSSIGNRGTFDPNDPNISHSAGIASTEPVGSAEALDKTLRDKFGDKLVQGLIDQGVLKYAKNTDEQTPQRGGVRAILRRPAEGQHTATLYYDKLTADKAPGVLMHELGEHFGIVRMLGQERYNVMLNDLRKLKNTPEVREVWDHVNTHYVGHLVTKNGKLVRGGIESKAEADQLAASVEGKAHKTPAGLASTEDPLFIREVAAHLVEKHPDLPFVRRLINEIRAFFYEKFGTTMGNRVDANLIRGLAASALRKASTGALPHMKTNTPPVAYRPFVAPSSRTPVGRAPMTQ